MNERYGNGWDRRVLAFLERFRDAGYLFQPSKEAETLEEMPTPRSWSTLAVLLSKGVVEEEVIESIIGPEMGQKFAAFMKIRIDLNELAREPKRWEWLSLDAKYLASIMLASEITAKTVWKWKPLLLEMGKDSREWLIVLSLAMPHEKRSQLYLAVVEMGGDMEQLFKEIEEVAKRL
jgi:hypothetical protein